ncbi:MAG: peptide chain release factor N(5)-glutamine methyltransferase, partial [Actinomycetota bacterium]
EEQGGLLEELVTRRGGGEPLQYLTRRQAFRRLDLLVGPGVLVPRPETEIVVEHALARLTGLTAPLVVDLGAGSGAIALAVATERPDAQVWAIEISPEAAAWARRNVERVAPARVTVLEGDLFQPLPDGLRGRLDLVVTNPPYLSNADLERVAPDVADHEPRVATVAGRSGLEIAKRVAVESLEWLHPGGWLVMETHPGQAGRLASLLGAGYVEVSLHEDLAGALRVAEGRACPPPARHSITEAG